MSRLTDLIRRIEEAGQGPAAPPPGHEPTSALRPPHRVGEDELQAVRPASFPLARCPVCGATPEELELVRRRRVLEEALARYEEHLASCGACRGWAGPWCEDGNQLRQAYLAEADQGFPTGGDDMDEGVV